MSGLIGRTRELEALEREARPGRLVTLVGPGGVGKTRLARELVERASPRFDGHAFLVDLSRAHDLEGIFDAVLSTLGLPADLAADPTRVVSTLVARCPALVVLDNFEQLLAHAPALSSWRVPTLAIVFTSRERLALEDERVIAIDPLPEPDAIALLRARAVDAITDEDAARAIVERAGHLPLAIELAAAQLDVLSPLQLARRLDAGVGALPNPRRDAPERHRTLDAAIRWSWELLSPEEQRALAAASVFAQPFAADAAEAIAGPAEVIASLRRKCLLVGIPGETLLLDFAVAVREFAAGRLIELGAKDAVEEAHARFFAAEAARRAGEILGPNEADAIRWLSAHRAELVRAQAWLAAREPDAAAGVLSALHPALELRGPIAQHDPLLDRAIELARDPSVRTRALLDRAEHRWRRGRLADAEADLRAVLERAEGGQRAEALRLFAQIDQVMERHEDAGERLREALALFEEAGDDARVALAKSDLGALHATEGDTRGALALFGEALEAHERRGVPRLAARELSRQGHALARERRMKAALAKFEEAARIHAVLDDRVAAGIDATMIAIGLTSVGRLGEALARAEEAVARNEEIGNTRFEAIARSVRAWVLLELGRVDEAEECFQRALRHHRTIGDPQYVGYSTVGLAWTVRARGDLDAARALLEEAEASLELAPEIRCFAIALRIVVELERDGASDLGDTLAARVAAITRPVDMQHRLAQPAYDALIALARASHATDPGARPERANLADVDAQSDRAALLEAAEAAARAFVPAEGGEERSADLRLLRAALDDALGASARLEVDERAKAATLGGATIDLSRRASLWGVLHALAVARARSPGEGLDVDALLAAGWPGEKVLARAAAARVRTAVKTLRELGLRDVLQTRGASYLLDPSVPVRLR